MAVSNALADESGFVQEQRAFLLPAQVTIAVAAGAVDVARAAASALTTLAEASTTSAVAASAAGARGQVALAEGRVDDAIHELGRCVAGWAELDAPYEAAQAKVELARAYDGAGRHDDGVMELESARAGFERIGAAAAAADLTSRLSAWASEQGMEIASRAGLETRVSELDEQYPGEAIPLPPFWGGYRIVPAVFEFWEGRPDRLHDRVEYLSDGSGGWRRRRLQP